MVVSSLEGLSDAQKQELVASLSAIVVGSSGADVTADSLSAVATASGNSLSGAWASVFASAVSKVRHILWICVVDGDELNCDFAVIFVAKLSIKSNQLYT